MLKRRLISAFVIISAMLLLLRLDFWLGTPEMLGRPGLVLCLLGLITAAMAAGELVHMWREAAARPSSPMVIAATLAMVTVSFMPVLWRDYPDDCPLGFFGWSFCGIVVALVMTFVWEMFQYGKTDPSMAALASPVSHLVADRMGRAMLVYVYLSLLFGFLIPLRFLDNSNSIGLIAIIALIATVKLSDSFAYFVGKSFGTVKMAPKLSPGKTVQGSFGALLGGCVAAAIVVFLVAPLIFGVTIDKPWWWFLLFGILVTCAGMLGDLAESLLKRDAQCKDSSSWLPGLGGVLDIIDSLLFATPVAFLVWVMV